MCELFHTRAASLWCILMFGTQSWERTISSLDTVNANVDASRSSKGDNALSDTMSISFSSRPDSSRLTRPMHTKNERTAQETPPQEGERDCQREEVAYRIWLGILAPLRWTCIGGGVVFSAAAGVSILWEVLPDGKLISALLAFTASALTAIHTALKCDSYQSECHRLIQAFKSLRAQFHASNNVAPLERPRRRNNLNVRYAQLIETAAASPAQWCYRRADRELTRQRDALRG